MTLQLITNNNILLSLASEHKKILIVGLYATGKSTLVRQLEQYKKNAFVYHSDDYINNINALVQLVNYRQYTEWIVEGSALYKVLRDDLLKPTLIVNCICSNGTRQQRYLLPERIKGDRYKGDKPGMKTGYKFMDDYYRKIWQEYIDTKPDTKIVEYLTEPII
jgi:hypothetical protein